MTVMETQLLELHLHIVKMVKQNKINMYNSFRKLLYCTFFIMNMSAIKTYRKNRNMKYRQFLKEFLRVSIFDIRRSYEEEEKEVSVKYFICTWSKLIQTELAIFGS